MQYKKMLILNTFAATPSLDAARMTRAEGAGRAMVRLTWDICSAFQQAPHVGFGKQQAPTRTRAGYSTKKICTKRRAF